MSEDLKKQIDDNMKKLEGLREEYDRLDANHPHQSSQVAKEISQTVKVLEDLFKNQKLMEIK